jgi:glycerol-3-phosphate O-acyltransferase
VDRLRDLFKFEFFYAPTEEFHQQIRAELARYAPNWEALLQQGAPGFLQLQNNMLLLVSHVTLLTYAEAYSVVADLLARMDASAALTEEQCVAQALILGRQAYLQRRISSPASIGKLLFKNGFKMAENRKLTAGGDQRVASGRKALAQELRDVLRRLELVRALGVATRGITVEKQE